jgi:anti-sigma factor RsiW
VTYREHPVDVESGGPHQVKPWFTGRLDFALPAVTAGDASFVLQGGSVGYFLDRKAAVLVYKKALHSATLLAFRADGLAFPRADVDLGAALAHVDAVRGFQVVVWRAGELGYALVSDVGRDDLVALARLIANPGN